MMMTMTLIMMVMIMMRMMIMIMIMMMMIMIMLRIVMMIIIMVRMMGMLIIIRIFEIHGTVPSWSNLCFDLRPYPLLVLFSQPEICLCCSLYARHTALTSSDAEHRLYGIQLCRS